MTTNLLRAATAIVLLSSLVACEHNPPANAAPPVAADVRGFTKQQKIRRLMQLVGAEAAGHQMLDQMMGSFERMPDLPPGFVAKFRELAAKEDLSTLALPAYEANMQEPDIDAAIIFYETPAGRNMVKAQPLIIQQSMLAGQQWGREMAEKTMRALHPVDN